MRPTPPEPPIEERDTEQLVDDLCIALRNVYVWERTLPEGKAAEYVGEVQRIYSELERRHAKFSARLVDLSDIMSVQMERFLQDCILYPSTIPWTLGPDGIRRIFRCGVCHVDEYPDLSGPSLCDGCLERWIESIRSQVALPECFIFRSGSPEECPHATKDTLLITLKDAYRDLGTAWCETCLTEERERRLTVKRDT